jgi:hypothetical protein
MVQTPAPGRYIQGFRVLQQGLLSVVKMDALTHNHMISRNQMRKLSKQMARCMVLNAPDLNRIKESIKDAVNLCSQRLNVDVTQELRFNPRLVAKSYLQAVHSAGFPEDQVRASRVLVWRYEEFLSVVKGVNSVDQIPKIDCERLLEAVRTHIQVFGENTPATPEEIKEAHLARVEFLVFHLRSPALHPNQRQHFREELVVLCVKLSMVPGHDEDVLALLQ